MMMMLMAPLLLVLLAQGLWLVVLLGVLTHMLLHCIAALN
jgi:hypothetical protein